MRNLILLAISASATIYAGYKIYGKGEKTGEESEENKNLRLQIEKENEEAKKLANVIALDDATINNIVDRVSKKQHIAKSKSKPKPASILPPSEQEIPAESSGKSKEIAEIKPSIADNS